MIVPGAFGSGGQLLGKALQMRALRPLSVLQFRPACIGMEQPFEHPGQKGSDSVVLLGNDTATSATGKEGSAIRHAVVPLASRRSVGARGDGWSRSEERRGG